MYSHLWVTVCQVIGHHAARISNLSGAEKGAILYQLLPLLMECTIAACDFRISPAPEYITTSTLTVMLQVLAAGHTEITQVLSTPSNGENQGEWPALLANISKTLSEVLLQAGTGLSAEAHVLLACCLDQLDLGETARSNALKIHDIAEQLVGIRNQSQLSAPAHGGDESAALSALLSLPEATAAINFLSANRAMAVLSALARHHTLSNAPERQAFTQNIQPAVLVLEHLAVVCFTFLAQLGQSGGAKAALPASVMTNMCVNVMTISCTLLQSLGRKTFYGPSTKVLEVAVWFADSSNQTLTPGGTGGVHEVGIGSHLMQDGSHSGLLLSKQMLRLLCVLAESSTSTGAGSSTLAALSLRLLQVMSTALSNDPRILAELLQDVLHAGIVATGAYWKRLGAAGGTRGLQLPGMGLMGGIAAQTAGGGGAKEPLGGTSPKGIVSLLCQLSAASMDPNVPPADALIAIEGVTRIVTQQNLLTVPWFFNNNTWQGLLSAVLRALLLRSHALHKEPMERLLALLTKNLDLGALNEVAVEEGEALPPELAQGKFEVGGVTEEGGYYSIYWWCLVSCGVVH